jgi:hypothetical protein
VDVVGGWRGRPVASYRTEAAPQRPPPHTCTPPHTTYEGRDNFMTQVFFFGVFRKISSFFYGPKVVVEGS